MQLVSKAMLTCPLASCAEEQHKLFVLCSNPSSIACQLKLQQIYFAMLPWLIARNVPEKVAWYAQAVHDTGMMPV